MNIKRLIHYSENYQVAWRGCIVVLFLFFSVGCGKSGSQEENTTDTTGTIGIPGGGVQEVSEELEEQSAFISDIEDVLQLQIEMATLAVRRASSEEIKSLASHIKADYSRMVEELQQIAESNLLAVPAKSGAIDESPLENLKTAEKFDKAWCSEMITVHKRTINRLENFISQAENTQLRSWIRASSRKLESSQETINSQCRKTLDASS